MVLMYGNIKPYARPRTNIVGQFAQITMFLFLFCGLLLKVQMDNASPDGQIFNMLVYILSLCTPLAPLVLKGITSMNDEIGDALEGEVD